MKKSAKILLSITIFISTLLAFAWPYIKMELASSAYYTQCNEREYEYYTPDLLKNMPRIPDNYEFAFGKVSGPQAQVFTIRFQDTNEAKKVRGYSSCQTGVSLLLSPVNSSSSLSPPTWRKSCPLTK